MYSECTDEALIARLKSNDPQALELLFKRYYKPLCQCCTLYTKDYAASEEIVADLFIKLWDNRQDQAILRVRNYLFVAARNLSLNHIQKKKNPVDSIEDLNMQPHFFQDTNTPFKILSARESNNRILLTIDQLPPRQREVLLMSRIDQMDKNTISALLGISVRTVETTLYQSIQQLRLLLNIS